MRVLRCASLLTFVVFGACEQSGAQVNEPAAACSGGICAADQGASMMQKMSYGAAPGPSLVIKPDIGSGTPKWTDADIDAEAAEVAKEAAAKIAAGGGSGGGGGGGTWGITPDIGSGTAKWTDADIDAEAAVIAEGAEEAAADMAAGEGSGGGGGSAADQGASMMQKMSYGAAADPSWGIKPGTSVGGPVTTKKPASHDGPSNDAPVTASPSIGDPVTTKKPASDGDTGFGEVTTAKPTQGPHIGLSSTDKPTEQPVVGDAVKCEDQHNKCKKKKCTRKGPSYRARCAKTCGECQ